MFNVGYTLMLDSLGHGKALALPRVTLHELRHSHGTYLLAKGVNILAVSKRTGHHSLAFTLERYGHLVPSMNDKIDEVLG